MPKAENLIVTGKCFLPIKPNKVNDLKNAITSYMSRKRDYLRLDIFSSSYEDHFLSMRFKLNLPLAYPSLISKLGRFIKLISNYDYESKLYFDSLRRITADIPMEVGFIIVPSKYEGKEGVVIEIRSKPSILFQIRQLGKKFPTDELEYSMILDSNKEFIYELMKSFGAKIIRKPEVILDYTKEIYTSPIIDELEKYGHNKVANIFGEGLLKLKKGKVKDSLDELRSALEIFTKRIADRYTDKSCPQDKIEQNLQVLRDKKIIDEEICGLMISIYYKKIYSYLSDKTHKREGLTIRDGEFLFSLLEDYFKYLIKRTIE